MRHPPTSAPTGPSSACRAWMCCRRCGMWFSLNFYSLPFREVEACISVHYDKAGLLTVTTNSRSIFNGCITRQTACQRLKNACCCPGQQRWFDSCGKSHERQLTVCCKLPGCWPLLTCCRACCRARCRACCRAPRRPCRAAAPRWPSGPRRCPYGGHPPRSCRRPAARCCSSTWPTERALTCYPINPRGQHRACIRMTMQRHGAAIFRACGAAAACHGVAPMLSCSGPIKHDQNMMRHYRSA